MAYLFVGRDDTAGIAPGYLAICDANFQGDPKVGGTSPFFVENNSGVLDIKRAGMVLWRLSLVSGVGTQTLDSTRRLLIGPSTLMGGAVTPPATLPTGAAFGDGSFYFCSDGTIYIRESSKWRRFSTSRTAVTSGAYTATINDSLIAVTGTSGATITLPAASAFVAGQPLIIKDEGGSAAASNIVIVGTIDGVSSATISTNYGSLRLYSSGSAWFRA
jgi:hypothetical protein